MQLCYDKQGDFMAEFCVDCYNEKMCTTDTSQKYIISKELELCEQCGQWKRVVIRYKYPYAIADLFREIVAASRKKLR